MSDFTVFLLICAGLGHWANARRQADAMVRLANKAEERPAAPKNGISVESGSVRVMLTRAEADLLADVIGVGMMKGYEFPPASPTKALFQKWIAELRQAARQ